MVYTYLLGDNAGVSNSENEILLPLNTKFRHEYGIYVTTHYLDDDGNTETRFDKITQVSCERLFSNSEIKAGKHK